MPDRVKEKLVELVDGVLRYLPWGEIQKDTAERIADRMMDNGVTVQEWISVKDGKPENDYGKHWKKRRHYLVRLQNGMMVVALYGYKDYGWWIDSHDCVLDKERYREVTHWMPLPQPPKGE